MTDLLERVRRGLREHADSVDPTPYPTMVPVFVQRRRRRQPRWLVPALAAVAVAAIAILVAPMVLLLGPGPAAQADGPAMLPQQFAKNSRLTAALSAAPLGRVIASYQYDVGDDLPFARPQSVVLASDRNAYRLVDAARARGDDLAVAPTLLSGDGTKIAVNDWGGLPSDVAVEDVRTGKSRSYPLAEPGVLTLLAWSPDARYLAYAVQPPSAQLVHPSTVPRGGRLTILDTESGERRELVAAGIPESVAEAAFSPDGRLLAVQEGAAQQDQMTQALPDQEVVVVDPVSMAVVRRVPVPDEYRLAGQQAWSPDGARLAVEWNDRHGTDGLVASYRLAKSVRFVDAAGTRLPDQIGDGNAMVGFLGWRSPERVMMLNTLMELSIVESNLDGGAPSRVSRVDTQPNDDRNIDSVQLAYALLPALRIWDPDGVDRGPWPGWFRLLLVAPICAALLIALTVLYRRSRRVRAFRAPQLSSIADGLSPRSDRTSDPPRSGPSPTSPGVW